MCALHSGYFQPGTIPACDGLMCLSRDKEFNSIYTCDVVSLEEASLFKIIVFEATVLSGSIFVRALHSEYFKGL